MTALAQDRPALRWGGSLGAALAIHGAAVAVALWWRLPDPPQPLPEPAAAVMVELAPSPTAPPAPPSAQPPGPPQQRQRKARPDARPQPAPEPPLQQTTPEAELPSPPLAKQPPDEQAQAAEDAAAEIPESSAPPSVAAPIGSQYAAAQTQSGVDAEQALASWQAQVLGHLQRFKRYPRAALRRRYEGIAQVRYAVDRQGNVLSADLERSSGRDLLDAEAVLAVQRASPLPRPPPEIAGDRVEVSTPVEFFLR